MSSVPCTAIVTAYRRIEQTVKTLEKLQNCQPAPEEIIVHVDGNQTDCAAAIRRSFPSVNVICSEACVGPGGGRNKLIAAARNEVVASFDDDSYPVDPDYFGRLHSLFDTVSGFSVVCAEVYVRGEDLTEDRGGAAWVAAFVGCGCAYRRSDFLATSGYVPLPRAYGMEEADVALRIHARGGRIIRVPWLRVCHDTDLKHRARPDITASTIENIALLTYLRYPALCWPIGLGQCFNQVVWLIRHGHARGILSGLWFAPRHLWRNKAYYAPVSWKALRSFLWLRRHPVPANVSERATCA